MGYTAFSHGVEQWELFSFVEQLHAHHHNFIVDELTALRSVAERDLSYEQKQDEKFMLNIWNSSALAVTAALRDVGVSVWLSHLPSVSQPDETLATGPRYYISVDEAWRRAHGHAVTAMPIDLIRRLWPHRQAVADPDGTCRVGSSAAAFLHNAGWVLVPPGSDAQPWHCDFTGQTGMRHILWKTTANGKACTTQAWRREAACRLLSADADGSSSHTHPSDGGNGPTESHESAAAAHDSPVTAVVFHSGRFLHRGAATISDSTWTTTFSLELSNPVGHRRWAEANPHLASDPSWKRTCVWKRGCDPEHVAKCESDGSEAAEWGEDGDGDGLRGWSATDRICRFKLPGWEEDEEMQRITVLETSGQLDGEHAQNALLD